MKINTNEQSVVVAKEQFNIEDVIQMCEDRDKVKYYLDNILIVGALKGYVVTQITYDFEFWKNYTIKMTNNNKEIELKFNIKNEKQIDSLEIDTHGVRDLGGLLQVNLGDTIKSLFSNRLFFSYKHEGFIVLLNGLLEFVLSE